MNHDHQLSDMDGDIGQMPKNINTKTNSHNICPDDMFYEHYQGLKLIPSRSASIEIIRYGLSMFDCRKYLELGYDCPRKRSGNVIEKWFDCGNKTINIVIAKVYNNFLDEDIYLITHIGMFGRK